MKPFTHEDIPGWFDFAEFYLAALDRARDGDVLVELGCWIGKSTVFLAQEAKRRNLAVRILAVDIFDNDSYDYAAAVRQGGEFAGLNPCIYCQFLENLRRAGVLGSVQSVKGRSENSAVLLPNASAALVFIDADHSFDAVCRDIDAWRPKVKPGGWLAGHDISLDSVRRAVASRVPDYQIFGSCWVA